MAEPLLTHDVTWHIDYRIHLGETWSRFFHGLVKQEIRATECTKCDRIFVPPQSFCEHCFEPVEKWTTVSPKGTLQVATIVYRGFEGGPTPPYAVGGIKLDGADTLIMHHIGGLDLSDPDKAKETLREGLRVEAVWNEDRKGSIMDIKHFVRIDE